MSKYALCKKKWDKNITKGKLYPIDIISEGSGRICDDIGEVDVVYWSPLSHMDNNTWEIVNG